MPTSSLSTDTPRVVWWITGTFIVLMLAYSVMAPTYRAPDEPQHVSLAHDLSEGKGYPAWDEGQINAGVVVTRREATPTSRASHLTASMAPHRATRDALEEAAGGQPALGINQLTQHPFLYYAISGGAVSLIERTGIDPIGSYAMETWVYRMLSILMLAPLPYIIWRCGRLLDLSAPVTVAAMLFPVANPQLTHLGGSVNNDNLVLLFFWISTPLILRIQAGALDPRTAALTGVTTGLAMLTKGFGLLLPLWVGVALLAVLVRDGRKATPRVLLAGATYGVSAFIVGGWWWIRNVVRYGELAPSRFDQLVPDRPGFEPDYLEFFQRWGDRTIRRFWGWFGWYDVSISRLLVLLVTVVTIGLIAVASRRTLRGGVNRSTRFVLLFPLVALISNQFLRALASHQRAGGWAGFQGRYWFGALAALSIAVAVGAGHLLGARSRWLPLSTFAVGVVLHASAAVAILSFYWGEPGSGLVDRIRAVIAWSPLPGELVVLGAVVGAVVVVGTARSLVRSATGGVPVGEPETSSETLVAP